MNITYKQRIYLYQLGGRTILDLFVEDGKLGVYMIARNKKEVFVELPKNHMLELKKRYSAGVKYKDMGLVTEYVKLKL